MLFTCVPTIKKEGRMGISLRYEVGYDISTISVIDNLEAALRIVEKFPSWR